MNQNVNINFNNTYAKLPNSFFSVVKPTPVKNPKLIHLNQSLCSNLGIDISNFAEPHGSQILSGNYIPVGADPISMVYAGHQFGSWVPQLGDGRAILLGEVKDNNGVQKDFQLKGSGPTPYSRMGDGRSPLGPVLREYLVSEAMYKLDIPTTRSLSVVLTGEYLWRDKPFPGAVLARIASSHVRVGTFEYFAAKNDLKSLKTLADYIIKRHFPDILKIKNPYLFLLKKITSLQSELIAKWKSIGFIHGVMNTDNTSISGETIDYGPCAFMDNYDSRKVFSSIDLRGRYSYENQEIICQWNLSCLANSILPLIDKNRSTAIDRATEVINEFMPLYDKNYISIFRKKLGLIKKENSDSKLLDNLLDIMERGHADFTLTFRYLSYLSLKNNSTDESFINLFANKNEIIEWLNKWRQRLLKENEEDNIRVKKMKQINPIIIPRNHIIENIISKALENKDFAPFIEFCTILQAPFADKYKSSRYSLPPKADQIVQQTFCGT